MYIARPRRRCAAEVPAPGAPIDNRWNKKLEFVYSLVTQIRAAARHPRPTLSKPFPASRTLPTTTAAPPTSPTNTSQRSLFRRRSPPPPPPPPPPAPLSSANVPRHERRRARYQHQQKAERRYQSTSGSYTGRDHLYPVAVTDTSTVYPPLVSLYFSPLFPARAPFRSVRRVCRTTCPSWPRMHLSNGETNW